ncbi:MAG: 8-oxo-dGTP diphosphatase [Saprospiraceae bacterium]|jgi:8-oxo-dGTP diphosphatase
MAKFKNILKVRLLLFSNGRILLLHQTKKNGGNLSLVGGTVEAEEHARLSLVRESIEEAGIIVKEEDLKLKHVLHKMTGKEHRMTLYFQADIYNGFPHTREPEKFKQAAWYDLDNLPAKLTGTVRHVLKEVRKGNIYSEFTKDGKR